MGSFAFSICELQDIRRHPHPTKVDEDKQAFFFSFPFEVRAYTNKLLEIDGAYRKMGGEKLVIRGCHPDEQGPVDTRQ